MAIALASRLACAARPAPRAASRSAAARCSPPQAVGTRRGSLSLRRAGAAPGEGSGVEEKWSPVASSDPLYGTTDELVAADDAAAAGGRAIVVTLDGGDASFRALDWALKNVARKKGACPALLPVGCKREASCSLTLRHRPFGFRPADTIHLINVIPLDRTYSPYSFQPLNIVADPNLPQLDPELRSAAEERGKQVLSDGVAAVHATGRAAVAHLIVERTWESVSHAVCAKANELDAAALVVANSGKNWVRSFSAVSPPRCRRRLMRRRFLRSGAAVHIRSRAPAAAAAARPGVRARLQRQAMTHDAELV